MGNVARQDPTACIVAAAVALIAALATPSRPLASQEVIELPAEDRLLVAEFEELYRLGSLDGDAWDTFGHVRSVRFDGAGNLYVFDNGAVRIHVVDQRGNLVRQFIGEGEGPGEFGEPSALEFGVMRDGRATVYDPNRMGFALFDTDNEFERTIPLERPHTHFVILRGIQAFPGMDRFLSTTEVGYMSTGEPSPDDEALAPFRYVLSFDLRGDQVAIDSVVAGWRPPVDGGAGFRPTLQAGVLPSGAVAFTDSSTYAIKLAAPDGLVTRILTRPFEPSPVTDGVKAAEKERRLEELGDGGGDPFREAMIEWERNSIEEMEFYHEVPVVLGLRTSWEGTIWVHHRGDEGTEGNRIDLISSEGRYLGTFASGSTAMPAAFGPNGLAAFVETDDLDVSYVVVRRLPDGLR